MNPTRSARIFPISAFATEASKNGATPKPTDAADG
jgi:hypothetical protein